MATANQRPTAKLYQNLRAGAAPRHFIVRLDSPIGQAQCTEPQRDRTRARNSSALLASPASAVCFLLSSRFCIKSLHRNSC
jgi:hypothetical protein